jgi:hypothetical protein
VTQAYPSMYEVLRTSEGKWFWWPSLQAVDYRPKGQQKYTEHINLSVT